jgi:hypothetical protein
VRYLKLLPWILWNAIGCALLALLVIEDHRRAIALVFLIPVQLMVNFGIYASWRQLRISGLSVIYLIGLVAGLIFVARHRTWWALIILVIPVAQAVWSIRRDRAKLLA